MIDHQEPFFTSPNRIFKYGLNASELAIFSALKSHDGRNSRGIYPSMPRLAEMTCQGLTSVKKALATLRACNMIQWQRGLSGRANTYVFLGPGAWVHKDQTLLSSSRKRTPRTLPAKGYAQLSHNDSKSHVTVRHKIGRSATAPVTHSHKVGRVAADGYDLDAHIPKPEPKNGDNSTFGGDNSQIDMTDRRSIGRHATDHRSPRDSSIGRHATANHTHMNQTHRTIPEESIFKSLIEKIRKKAAYAEHDD